MKFIWQYILKGESKAYYVILPTECALSAAKYVYDTLGEGVYVVFLNCVSQVEIPEIITKGENNG